MLSLARNTGYCSLTHGLTGLNNEIHMYHRDCCKQQRDAEVFVTVNDGVIRIRTWHAFDDDVDASCRNRCNL